MAKTKSQKQEIEEGLKEKLERQKALVFVDYRGLGVKDLNVLRSQLRAKEAQMQVVKKTLLSRALAEHGIAMNLRPLEGQLAAVFAFGDPLAALKEVYVFGKKAGKLNILAGFLEGREMDGATLQRISLLPSREQLLGQLVGTMAAPLTGFMGVLQGNIKGLVYILAQKAKQ
ncbi:MAG: 50S ribosomal protein L10 [Patescibacteria group bacterium]